MSESAGQSETLSYQRSSFTTHLRVSYRYTPNHYWLDHREGDLWRVGLTKFAVRLLGEMVDFSFETERGGAVTPGDPVGWLEGFKSISDLYAVVRGRWEGENPILAEDLTVINHAPQDEGWLYQARGEPDPQCLDVRAYRDLLDHTICRLLAERDEEPAR